MNNRPLAPEIDVSKVNPQMVTLARQARGLTQAELAERMTVSQATISKIEAGAPLSKAELTALSAALDFPEHFFVKIWRVEGPGASELYHRKRQKASAAILYQVYAKADIEKENIKTLLRSWEYLTSDFPLLSIEQYESKPDKIARTVRAMLRLPMGAISNMTQVIEDAGGIVIASDFGTRHIDAFSRRPSDCPPIFFINRELPPDRWRWTLAHELGHIIMHPGMIPHDDMEKEADAFAAEFLTPAFEIKPQLVGLTFQKLSGLKRLWKVSIQALIMRAYQLAIITDRQRRTMFMQMSQAGYRLREPMELDPPAEPPVLLARIVEHHRRVLRYSDQDLCDVLAINERDLAAWYPRGESRLRLIS